MKKEFITQVDQEIFSFSKTETSIFCEVLAWFTRKRRKGHIPIVQLATKVWEWDTMGGGKEGRLGGGRGDGSFGGRGLGKVSTSAVGNKRSCSWREFDG